MKKNDFNKLETALKERGYKMYRQHWHSEDYVLGTAFRRKDNRWDESRASYQVLLSVYDYTLHPEYHDRLPEGQRDHVGIDIRVNVSRVIDERLELSVKWDDDMTIEEVECIADSFYRWVLTAYPEPRNINK